MNPFDISGFPARWSCGPAWAEQPWVGWLHILSDLVIFMAYFAVPVVVMYFVRQRDDLRFPPIFYGFLAMIFISCGTVHLIEAGIFWWPAYKLAGYVKLGTALVSAAGVVLLARVLPTALDLKSGAAYANAVAERRKAQELLKFEQFLLQTMMRNSPDLIYFKDCEGRFTRASNSLATFLGKNSPDELVGKSDSDFFSAEFAESARADEQQLLRTREAIVGKEESWQAADGSAIWLSSTKLTMCNESGEVIGVFGLAHDITPQKHASQAMAKAKEVAESANQAKSDFLANVSHEIRTPMNSIMGMTELVLDTELTATQEEYLSIAYESAETLLALIDEILDFSKIEAGKLEFDNVDVDLREEIGDTLKSLALRAHAKGLELAWRAAPAVPKYYKADCKRLRQLIVNLIGNAIKFTREGEVLLELTLAESQDDSIRLHLVVSDTGIGIPTGKLEHIFDAFAQADASTTREYGGTGLGLAITKRIVEELDGRIWVESEEGQGSQFHCEIVLALGEAPADRPAARESEFRSVSVVVVDDNESNCRILREILEGWKMQVWTVTRAEEAIPVIRRVYEEIGELPLLISDGSMPEMDGFMLVEALRKDSVLRQTLAVMLTAGGRSEDTARYKELDVTAHMMKPVKQSELQQAIAQVLGQLRPEAEPARDADLPTFIRPLRILLAEDGRANQRLAIALLEKWGHTVVLAEDGQQAIACWQQQPMDLILMDAQMPVLDGLAATAEIRRQEAAAGQGTHVPIVAMTARTMKGDREACLAAGMDDYVSKPIRRQELQLAIARAASGQSPPPSQAGKEA
jgi:two-component system sensor histidine kinase/response regulator